ncbi:hypothetical protein QQL38_25035 [Pseudomonas syringae]|uniref:hypothetical protein n=1 Tax=Pseudomonas syringae TaxID=317 RepID=UPI0020BE2585|nr:hypothetical protein [Pseudomonas syringae]MCL6309710.1 hypothetical protein [Pseudomonas syringae]
MAAITKALIGQDTSGELRDECGAHLDTLMALGTAKSQYYAEKINTGLLGAGQGTDKTFPITTIQSFVYQTRAYTSDNASNISGVINDSIKGFVAGDNEKAVGSLVNGFVSLVFGASEGSETEVIRYCAILEGASMVRLDFAGWSRSVSSTALKNKCDRVSAFVLYRSIVDMKKVTLNDFIAVYQATVKAENPGIDTANVLIKCKELFFLFNPEQNPTPAPRVANLLMASGTPKSEATFQPSKGHDSLDVFFKQIKSL